MLPNYTGRTLPIQQLRTAIPTTPRWTLKPRSRRSSRISEDPTRTLCSYLVNLIHSVVSVTTPEELGSRVLTSLVLFFRTRHPLDPVSFVQRICQDAANGVEQKHCRFVKRLTPITAIDKATDRGLEEVAQQVLAPHFHGPDRAGKKVRLAFSRMCGVVRVGIVRG